MQQNVNLWNDLALGFYKVAKYYYGPDSMKEHSKRVNN